MYFTNFILFLCNLLIYKKGSLCFDIQLFMDKMKKVKEKKEKGQKIDPAPLGFEPRIFEQVSTHNLNFEGD